MLRPNDLDALWLPFTPNRHFKQKPRIIARAKGIYFYDENGRAIIDGCSGLWCSNLGHGRPEVADAIARSARDLDFAPTFQFGHPDAFTLASRVAALAPAGLDHTFFVNSGSEAVETALKIARAYFQKIGQTQRTRLIGRDKGYHGVSYGGISVGGMPNNKKNYGPLVGETEDQLPFPYDPAQHRFTRGEGRGRENYADALEKIVAERGAETIAAVIVEPMSGSAGVFPTDAAYMKRLRALCDKHGILLIFDEVITAFGRLGHGFAAERYGVTPDIITFAKGVTNGAVPMGGTVVANKIYEAFLDGPDHAISLFHGNTYSGHPLACAAGLASLDVYASENLFGRGLKLEPVLEDAVHGLKGASMIADIRNVGLAAAVELVPDAAAPGRRGYETMQRCFYDEGLMVRLSGDTLVIAPALVATEDDIGKMVGGLKSAISKLS